MGDRFVDSPRSRGESGHDSDGINIIPVLIRELEQVAAGRTPAQASRQFAAGDIFLGSSVLLRTTSPSEPNAPPRVWKYLLGSISTALMQDATSCGSHVCGDCSAGCLFDVLSDPNETAELSSVHHDIAAEMRAALVDLTRRPDGSFKFHPFPVVPDETDPLNYEENRACTAYRKAPLYSSVGSFGFCGVAPNVYDDDPVRVYGKVHSSAEFCPSIDAAGQKSACCDHLHNVARPFLPLPPAPPPSQPSQPSPASPLPLQPPPPAPPSSPPTALPSPRPPLLPPTPASLYSSPSPLALTAPPPGVRSVLTKLKQLYLTNTQVLHGAAALTVLLLVAAACAAFAFAERSTRRRADCWNTHGRHTKLPADEVCVDEEEHFTESTTPLPAKLTEESATISGHAVDHRAVRIVQAPLQMPLPLLPLLPSLPPLPPLPPPLLPPPPPLEPSLQLPLPQQAPTPEAVQTDTCDGADEVYSL